MNSSQRSGAKDFWLTANAANQLLSKVMFVTAMGASFKNTIAQQGKIPSSTLFNLHGGICWISFIKHVDSTGENYGQLNDV